MAFLIHLSDIHFRKSEIETELDPNFNLRNEIVRDAESFCKDGPPDAIIVTGDISFAGDPDEFKYAKDWLSKLAERCSTDLSAVFVCPGNHDVVRSIAGKPTVQIIHESIKGADPIVLESTLLGVLRADDTSSALYESLENYNLFAQQFFCALTPPNRTRARRDIVLNDGSILRLWGLNSTFVSSAADKLGDLFVDTASFQITRESGVANAVICHHPPNWLRNGQQLANHLADTAVLHLFGHVHDSRVELHRDFIRLTAGAMNPARDEHGWEPGYNLIHAEVEGEGEARSLKVRVDVRVWQSTPGRFNAKIDRHGDPIGRDLV